MQSLRNVYTSYGMKISTFFEKKNGRWGWSCPVPQATKTSRFYFRKQCVKINIFHILVRKSITTWVSEIPIVRFLIECYRNTSYLSPMYCNFWEKWVSQRNEKCYVERTFLVCSRRAAIVWAIHRYLIDWFLTACNLKLPQWCNLKFRLSVFSCRGFL